MSLISLRLKSNYPQKGFFIDIVFGVWFPVFNCAYA